MNTGSLKITSKRVQNTVPLKSFTFSNFFSQLYFYENSSRFFLTLSALGGFYSSDDKKEMILKHETVTLGGFYSSDNEKARILKHETVTLGGFYSSDNEKARILKHEKVAF